MIENNWVYVNSYLMMEVLTKDSRDNKEYCYIVIPSSKILKPQS